jgi:hypothetical protein
MCSQHRVCCQKFSALGYDGSLPLVLLLLLLLLLTTADASVAGSWSFCCKSNA